MKLALITFYERRQGRLQRVRLFSGVPRLPLTPSCGAITIPGAKTRATNAIAYGQRFFPVSLGDSNHIWSLQVLRSFFVDRAALKLRFID